MPKNLRQILCEKMNIHTWDDPPFLRGLYRDIVDFNGIDDIQQTTREFEQHQSCLYCCIKKKTVHSVTLSYPDEEVIKEKIISTEYYYVETTDSSLNQTNFI